MVFEINDDMEHLKKIDKKDLTTLHYDLLLLADPSLELIENYLAQGLVYTWEVENECIGICVVAELDTNCVEIKNIAIAESYHRRGWGRKFLRSVVAQIKKTSYKKLYIATGNSSLGQLALYQREGFSICAIHLNHFTYAYREPIYEDGILCEHQIVLVKRLD